jgi:hypothetical protein
MTTFALIHGTGDSGWAWHLVQHELRKRGHEAVAPDLPSDRDDATWDDCAAAVVGAVGSDEGVVVVGQSSGGFVVPLVADRVDALLQVYLAGMVPQLGETAAEWFDNVGWFEAVADLGLEDDGRTGHSDPLVGFYHDVSATLASRAMARERPTSERLGGTPWPGPGPVLSTVPARYIVTTQDRFIPPPVQRHVAAERLAITEPDTINTGHCPNLSRPESLADLLAGYVDRG